MSVGCGGGVVILPPPPPPPPPAPEELPPQLASNDTQTRTNAARCHLEMRVTIETGPGDRISREKTVRPGAKITRRATTRFRPAAGIAEVKPAPQPRSNRPPTPS